MAEPFAPYAGIEGAALTGGEGGDALHNLLMGILQGTATLPKRVIDAAQATAPGLRREDFTDVPGAAQPGEELRRGALEAASLPMAGTMFSAPVGALGSGPVVRSGKPSLEELFAESKRRIAEAESLAKEAAAAGRMIFEKDGRKAAISPSLNPEYAHRVTEFDNKGPIGHREYKNNDFWGLESDIRTLLGAGYKVKR